MSKCLATMKAPKAIVQRQNMEPERASQGNAFMQEVLAASSMDRDSGDGGFLAAAEAGMEGSSGQLPHLRTIQSAFGQHDVTGVAAHQDEAAAMVCAGLGARAFALGDRVALTASGSDLHTVAHEAAHTVQQRGGGVALSGGVGQGGDAFEQHADAVADAVVRGESAEALLDEVAPGGASGSAGSADQLQLKSSLGVSIAGLPSVKADDTGKITVSQGLHKLWDPVKLQSPTIMAGPVPLFLDLTTKGSLDVLAGLDATARDMDPMTGNRDPNDGNIGSRLKIDLNGEVRAGVPKVASISAGVGLRSELLSQVSISEKEWSCEQGTLIAKGALLAACNLGPRDDIRVELRFSEGELLRFTKFKVGSDGVTYNELEIGETLTAMGEKFDAIIDAINPFSDLDEMLEALADLGTTVFESVDALGKALDSLIDQFAQGIIAYIEENDIKTNTDIFARLGMEPPYAKPSIPADFEGDGAALAAELWDVCTSLAEFAEYDRPQIDTLDSLNKVLDLMLYVENMLEDMDIATGGPEVAATEAPMLHQYLSERGVTEIETLWIGDFMELLKTHGLITYPSAGSKAYAEADRMLVPYYAQTQSWEGKSGSSER